MRRDGFLLETGPNTVRPTPELLEIVAELALGSELLVADPLLPRYVDFRGRLHPLPTSPLALLTTRLLSVSGKLGILAEPFRRSPAPPDESVRDFFARRLGPEVAERVVAPFVSGIFAGDASRLSAPDAFPALTRWEREAGSVLLGAIRGARASRRGTTRPRPGARPPLVPRGALDPAPGDGQVPRKRVPRRSRPSTGSVRPPAASPSATHAPRSRPTRSSSRLRRPMPPTWSGRSRPRPRPRSTRSRIPLSPSCTSRGPSRRSGARSRASAISSFPTPRGASSARSGARVFSRPRPGGAGAADRFPRRRAGPRGPAAGGRTARRSRRARPRSGRARPGSAVAAPATRWERSIPQYTNGHASRMRALARAEARWPGLRFAGNYRGGISVGDVVKAARAV